MAAAQGRAFILLSMVVSMSWALPQRGFPNNSPSSVRGQVFSTSQPQQQQYPIIPYSYGYEVQDPLTNNYQNKAEIKTANGDVYGSYSVLMPDGYIYTTTYSSTPATGFVSRLVKTLAILPQQQAAQAKSQQQVQQLQQLQQQQQPAAVKPQQFQRVKSQPQFPQQQLLQVQPQQQPAQQLHQVNQFHPQLPRPQQFQPQQQQQFQPQQQQQLSQPQQIQQLQQLHKLQLVSQPQQVQSQQLPLQFLQTQQPLLLPTELHGPLSFTV